MLYVPIHILDGDPELCQTLVKRGAVAAVLPRIAHDSEIPKLKEAMLPDSVGTLGTRVFSGCETLVTARIGTNVQNMGNMLFAGCKEMKSLECHSSIGSSSFQDIENLESVTLGSTVVNIGDQAFSGCKKLLEVVMPEGVETIGDRAFYNCEALRKISMPRTLTKVGAEFFYGAKDLATLYYNGSSDMWGLVEKDRNNNWSKNLPGSTAWISDFEIQKVDKENE
jgi:hypothetical protein